MCDLILDESYVKFMFNKLPRQWGDHVGSCILVWCMYFIDLYIKIINPFIRIKSLDETDKINAKLNPITQEFEVRKSTHEMK